MKAWEKVLHLVIFAAWFGASVYYGLRIAACGNEEDRLEHQRGADLTIRRDIDFERVDLRTEIDLVSRREFIDAELRKLRLRLRPIGGGAPPPTVLASFVGEPGERRP